VKEHTARLNADHDRHTRLAKSLRDAWHTGSASWLDLAGIALAELKPGRADADAVFTVELQPNRSQVRTQAPWGGDPETLVKRAIAALEAELAGLKACPVHREAALATTQDPQNHE
jgi:hypothetical protein